MKLLEKRALEAVINGGVKCAINEHGPITLPLIQSATKRILGSLLTYLSQTAVSELTDEAVQLEIDRLRKSREEKDKKIVSQSKQINDLLAKQITLKTSDPLMEVVRYMSDIVVDSNDATERSMALDTIMEAVGLKSRHDYPILPKEKRSIC